MTFPATPLDVRADLGLSGTWTSMTAYIYKDTGPAVAITRGRPPEAASPQPCTAAFRVTNTDHRFSPHAPAGAWYGLIGRNTRARFAIPGASARLRMEDDAVSYASTPSSAGLNVAGDLELRIDAAPSNWTASVLASKWSATSGNWSWAWLLNADGTLTFAYTTDGATIVQAVSTQPLPWPGGRISLKVTRDHTTGTVSFWYATSIGGSYTQLGAAVTMPAGAVYAGTAALAVGANSYFAALPGYQGTYGAPPGTAWQPVAAAGLLGSVYEFRLYSGIAGTLVADPIFSAQADGTTSFADGHGNTWTLAGTATISSRDYRFHGEVSEWPPQWDPTGSDVWTDVTASGLLRRLSQKNPPLPSAFTRAWQQKTGIYAPLAYWPGEDGNNSQVVTLGLVSSSTSTPTVIASGLPAGLPMVLSGAHKTAFASSSVTDFLCTSPLPVPNTDTWMGPVAPYTNPASGPANVVRFLLAIPSGGDTNGVIFVRMYTTGTVAICDFSYTTGGGLQLTGYDDDGNQLFLQDVAFGQNGKPCLAEMALTVSGGTITWHINTLDLGATAQLGLSGTVPGSLGVITSVVVNPRGGAISSAIGQIAVQSSYARMDSASSPDALIGPLNAWAGETAGLRFARLCAEQGYACRVTGYPSASVAMGGQAPQTFLTLLQECESADHGVIYEPRSSFALAYRTSASMAAQASAASGAMPVALDYSLGNLGGGALQAVDDDQLTVNDELVTRGSGSVTGSLFEATLTAAQYAATSALSISAPPAGVGLYQDAQTVSVWLDSQLGDQACWLVHLGTADEPRHTQIPVDLADTDLASIFYPVTGADVGDYVQITNPPPWLTPDAVKTLVWGLSEQLGVKTCKIQWSARPESPYEVLVLPYGTGVYLGTYTAWYPGTAADPRAGSDGSTLHTSYSNSATSLVVDIAAGEPLWTTAAGDLPFDIVVAGERMTVTAVSGASSPQTMIVIRSVNGVVKAQASGAGVNVFVPVYAALA